MSNPERTQTSETRSKSPKKSSLAIKVAGSLFTFGALILATDRLLENNNQAQKPQPNTSGQSLSPTPEATSPEVKPKTNLISNGDFEISFPVETDVTGKVTKTTIPGNWGFNPQEFEFVGIIKENPGSNVLFLEVYHTPEGKQIIPIASYGEINIDPNSNYRLSFKGKSQIINREPNNPPTLAPALQVEFTDPLGNPIKRAIILAVPKEENSWQDFEYALGPNTPLEFPQNAKGLKIGLSGASYRSTNHSGDKIYYDDLELIPEKSQDIPSRPQA